MKLFSGYLVLLFLQGVLTAQENYSLAPSWVTQRPSSSSRFIGIGMAEKIPGSNYIMEAKKNALYDLVSEIKVNISSNSVLYSYQNNNQFNQTYNSLIRLSNTDNIEGYEQGGTYENEKQYWVFYFLDKETYFRKIEQKKQLTLSNASRILQSAEDEWKAGNYAQSLLLRSRAFGTLIPYLNEDIKLDPKESGGNSDIIDLTRQTQQQLDYLVISFATQHFSIIPMQSTYLPFMVKFNTKNGTMRYDRLPLRFYYEEEDIRLKNDVVVCESDGFKINPENVYRTGGEIIINAVPDLLKMAEQDSVARAGASLMIQLLTLPTLKVALNVNKIKIYLRFDLLNFSKKTDAELVSAWQNFVVSYLTCPVFEWVDVPQIADYHILFQANTQISSDNIYLQPHTGHFLSELQVNIILMNFEQKEIFRHILSGIYGSHPDKTESGIQAYNSRKTKQMLHEACFHVKRNIIKW